jgi:uncharacterized protein
MISSKKITVFFSFFVSIVISILGLSYYTLYKVTFAGDRIWYGKKASELAIEVREEVFKKEQSCVVRFPSLDGVDLAGILFKRPKATANLLVCHGYRGSKEFMYAYLDLFPNFNVLMFDFRAHGESSGQITSIGCHEYKDVIAAAQYLKNHDGNEIIPGDKNKKLPLILLGISMGGASCLKAMQKNIQLCDVLVIDSTFASLEKMLLRAFNLRISLPYYPFFHIIRRMFHFFGKCDIKDMSAIDCVKKIRQPIFFIHSCIDAFIPPENSIQLYAHSINVKSKLWIAPRCRHGWLHSYHSNLYKHKIEKFLNKTIFSS